MLIEGRIGVRAVANDAGHLTAELLFEGGYAFHVIDNMEAIAAHRSASGETILTLMSDDNFSPLQRTLIMQFAMPDRKPVAAGLRD